MPFVVEGNERAAIGETELRGSLLLSLEFGFRFAHEVVQESFETNRYVSSCRSVSLRRVERAGAGEPLRAPRQHVHIGMRGEVRFYELS